ncbi:alpha/beta hydrolase [Pseudoalteromonas citrea]|uniref:Alpha/beta hydrolase n=1 Tax=Pseudoalteromonas citrea TaxID=43655 RepID=A0A5S3XNH2_9GAMM|nr:alpha/beta fold hydrolase [Pseudoalteromonas citrea]TMP41124.1 alpha/beta hydrolase [Pseudoalteromonas citrea]TMP56255.1 alpha/beta hydrolase [Pseudoalteromonas citrea]
MKQLITTLSCVGMLSVFNSLATPIKSVSYSPYVDFEWGECPTQFQSYDKRNQCSLAEVPLDWDAPNGKKIDVLVSKYPAKSGNSQGQIWFLQGGPGASGSFYVDEYETHLNHFTQDYDLYVLEHRGVGWSTHLTCSNPPLADYADYAQACFDDLHQQWGEGLYKFTTTSAAKDLEYAITKSKTLDWQPTYVYGASYGTLWAQRFSQVAPTGAQGIILDSVVPSEKFGLDSWDKNFNDIFADMFTYCQSDEFCRTELSLSSVEELKTLVNRVYAGEHCPATDLKRFELQAISLLALSRSVEQILMPMYHRLARCNNNDVIALNNLHNFMFKGVGKQFIELAAKDPFNSSPIVSKLIVSNEINYNEIDLQSKLAYCKDAISCIPEYLLYQRHIDKQVWGDRYTDPYIYQPTRHYMPTLLLNGDLDPQTPHYYVPIVQSAFTNNNQRYVELPETEHGVIFVSHSKKDHANTCGVDIMHSFINNLWSQPDTSCIADLKGLDFAATQFESQVIFGSGEAYNGTATPQSLTDLNTLKQNNPTAYTRAYGAFLRLADF